MKLLFFLERSIDERPFDSISTDWKRPSSQREFTRSRREELHRYN